MKLFYIFSIILFTVVLISCGKDSSIINEPTTVTKFIYSSSNDTMTVNFEVTGTTTSQPRTYVNPGFDSVNFYLKMDMQTVSNGNIKFNIYKNDTILVKSLTYSLPGIKIDSSYSTPPINSIQIIPTNFSGKGIFKITKK